ncbi:hypothetical protein JYK22_04135, partial [Nonomuraea sp. RK-328]|nr:hypothetical protein [Nonomuraea sp. RK-328]
VPVVVQRFEPFAQRAGFVRGEPEVSQHGVPGVSGTGGRHLRPGGVNEELGPCAGFLVQPESPADQLEALFGAAAHLPGAREADEPGFAQDAHVVADRSLGRAECRGPLAQCGGALAQQEFVPRLVPGGLLVLDNVFLGGTVLDPAFQGEDQQAMRRVNDAFAHDERLDRVMLPVRDGVTLARKR